MTDILAPASPIGLHPGQREVFDNLRRFNVIAAGRRWGKTHFSVKLACWYLRHTHWEDGTDLADADVWFVSPTIDLALETVVPMVYQELGDEIKQHHKVQNWFSLENGARLYLKSGNRPETLRGRKVRFLVLDEVSIMRPGLWETVLRPSLVDVRGRMLAIGTPIGRGQLYEMYSQAESNPDWGAWKFKTIDNPHISKSEVEAAGRSMTKTQFKQEFLADWSTGGGNVFQRSHLKAADYQRGVTYMAAVFGSDEPFAKDAHALSGTETALILARLHPLGWHVIVAQRGFWPVSETIRRISELYDKHACRFLALSVKDEKAAKNMITEYRRHHDARISIRYQTIQDSDDLDRIKWALQQRLKSGRITCVKGKALNQLRDQLQDFPLEYSNNELVQALSYIDQLPQPNFGRTTRQRFYPLDRVAGY